MYSEYILDSKGVERRKPKSMVLGPVRKPGGEEMRKREAQRLLQLKTIQERLGHSLSGSLTLDVYIHAEWTDNVEATQRREKR